MSANSYDSMGKLAHVNLMRKYAGKRGELEDKSRESELKDRENGKREERREIELLSLRHSVGLHAFTTGTPRVHNVTICPTRTVF